MDIPNLIYRKFYNAIKTEFLKHLSEPRRKAVQNRDNVIWYELVPNTTTQYVIAKLFAPINISPKYLYNKFLDSTKDDVEFVTLKDDIFFRACYKLLQLRRPGQLNSWSALEPIERCQLMLQLYLEAYEPVLFSTFPELKVFDRLTGKFGVVLQQNSPDTLISADENAQDSNKTSVIPDDILLNTNEMLAVVTKYMSLLSNGKYIEAFEMLSLNTRQRDWNNNPLDFAAQYHFTFEINLLSISQVRARFDSYHQRPEAYCFVGYEQNVLSRTSDELKRLLFEDHKIELIVEFAKDVNSFIRLAEQSGINGLKDLSIRSLFSVEFVDLLLNFAKSNRAEYKALFPKDFELTVHQFVELDLSYENGEWWIEDHIPFNAGYYFENGFENDRSMRI